MAISMDEQSGAHNMKLIAIAVICRMMKSDGIDVDVVDILEAITAIDYEKELEHAKSRGEIRQDHRSDG